MIAAMELGGTKTVVAVGERYGTLGEEHRYPKTTPKENWTGFSITMALRRFRT